MPLFTSFDEAWEWFLAGGELSPIAEQRARLTGGRAQLLAFQIPMLSKEVLALSREVQDEITDIEGLLPLDEELLHCSLRAAGFQVLVPQRPDDVAREDVPRLADRAARALKGVPSAEVTVGPVNVFPDALILEVHDGGGVRELRSRLTAATSEDAFVPDEEHFLPHISLAFFEDASLAGALRERLPALRQLAPVAARFERVDFVRWWLTDADATEQPELDVLRSFKLRR